MFGRDGGQSASRRAISVFEKKERCRQHGDGNECCWQVCLSKRDNGRYIGNHIYNQVVKNDISAHNLIVCTLCSCYPAAVLGLNPDWYKSCHYRSMAVRAPRQLLQQFGLHVPAGTRVVTHDSTAEMRYMVLPMRPRGTDGWGEAQLRTLVTRDCMIGTQLPIEPS